MTEVLGFAMNREVIIFKIEDKKIFYFDRKWQNGFQFMPKEPTLIRKLIMSRNRIPMAKQILAWVQESNSGENLKEYQNAKDDKELAEIVRRDAKKKGLIEFKAKLQDDEGNLIFSKGKSGKKLYT